MLMELGPVVDGNFVPDLPGKLLLQGAFAKNLKVMVGHNANEVGDLSLLNFCGQGGNKKKKD